MALRFESPFVSFSETFKTVAAGHAATQKAQEGPVGLLGEVDESGEVRSILKLMDEHEHEIYALISDSYNTDCVYEVVPKFQGVTEKTDATGTTHKYIRIENVLHGFSDPKVIDVKLGCRSFLESESQNKKSRPDLFKRMLDMYPEVVTEAEKEAKTITKARFMSVRDQNSTLGSLGFRIDGMGGADAQMKKTIKDVTSLRCQADTVAFFERFCELAAMVPDSNEFFVCPGSIARQIHQRVARLHSILECSNFVSHHEFIGSSLLLIADRFGHTGVWWIDFAKTYVVPEGIELTHRDPWVQGNHEDGLLKGSETLTEVWAQVSAKFQDGETWVANASSSSLSQYLGCFPCLDDGMSKLFGKSRWRVTKTIEKNAVAIKEVKQHDVDADALLSLDCFVARMPSSASLHRGGDGSRKPVRRITVASLSSLGSLASENEVEDLISPAPGRHSGRHSTGSQWMAVNGGSPAISSEAEDQDHIVSRRGCTYTFLRDFVDDGNNSTMGMAQLRSDVIMPRTSTPICSSFAEMAHRTGMEDSDGTDAFADATHFVAHVAQYGLESLVDATGCWLTQSGANAAHVYFWLDLFSMNHHQANQMPQEWFSTRYLQAIGDIGHTVIILEPWENPVALKRSWVVWELYCTIVTGARLSFTMTHETRSNFSNALLDSFQSVQTAMLNINISSCRAFYQHDQDMINKEIMRSMGYTWLSDIVNLRLKEWLIGTINDELEVLHALVMPKHERHCGCWQFARGKPREHQLFLFFRLKSNLATMLRETGNLTEAEAFGWELQAQVERYLGSHHHMAMHCLHELALCVQKRGKTEQALTLHRECLKRRRRELGQSHKDTLASTCSLAVSLSETEPLSQDRFIEARELFQLAITKREVVVGTDESTTLYTVSMFGRLLTNAPHDYLVENVCTKENRREAGQLHERAVNGLLQKFSEVHPLSLTALHNQALHWLKKGADEHDSDTYVRGLKQLQRVGDLRTEKLGGQHPDTIETLRALSAARPRKRVSVFIRKLQDDEACKELITVNWKQLTIDIFPELHTTAQFREIRRVLRSFGIRRLRAELLQDGYVDGATDQLTVGFQPFNVFARMAAGITSQPHMAATQLSLRQFKDRYLIAGNRPECDENWDSTSLSWVGKASMSKCHMLLLVKDLHWEWFNVLTYGLVSCLDKGIERLEEIREAALLWVRDSYGDAWPESNVGLYLQVHAQTPVTATVLHILDTRHLGPSFHKSASRILHIDDAISALKEEKEDMSLPDVRAKRNTILESEEEAKY